MLAAALILALAAPADAAAVARGKTLYAENRCSMCHSIAGKGNPKGPHDGVGSRLSAAELRKWLLDPKDMARKTKATRKPPMPLYDQLKPAEVDDLVAYLSTLKSKP